MYNEKEAIRAYVTGADHLQYTQLAEGMVQVRRGLGRRAGAGAGSGWGGLAFTHGVAAGLV